MGGGVTLLLWYNVIVFESSFGFLLPKVFLSEWSIVSLLRVYVLLILWLVRLVNVTFVISRHLLTL